MSHKIRHEDGWIQTFTGRQFWPLDPKPKEVEVRDIAHALANLCRFTGHVDAFYSVAQHSVLMARDVQKRFTNRPELPLWALLHDAAEAYISDLSRPVKAAFRAAGSTAYADAEDRLLRCVATRFGLPWPIPAEIHQADLILLATERRDLMGPPPRPWRSTKLVSPLRDIINPWTPSEAKAEFLKEFKGMVDSVGRYKIEERP